MTNVYGCNGTKVLMKLKMKCSIQLLRGKSALYANEAMLILAEIVEMNLNTGIGNNIFKVRFCLFKICRLFWQFHSWKMDSGVNPRGGDRSHPIFD